MNRKVYYIANEAVRANVIAAVRSAPVGYRVEIKEAKRTLDQNSRLWALLTEVSEQKEHCGRYYPPEIWKCLFMQAWGREVRFIPSLDGDGVIPLAYHSSELSKHEMSDLQEFIVAWGTQNGIVFQEPQQVAAE